MGRQPLQILAIPYRRVGHNLEVLVLHRRHERYWQFVAGGVEGPESLAQAALRECSEELGLPIHASRLMKLDTLGCIPRYHFKEAWSESQYIVPEYAFALDCGGLSPQIGEEHDRCVWEAPSLAYLRLRYDSNRTALWELCRRLGIEFAP